MIIIVNGSPGCGKTTFEEYCLDYLGHDRSFILSTIDCVKAYAHKMGWNGVKTPEARKFLSDLKEIMVHSPWGDITFNDVLYKISKIANQSQNKNLFFFVDSREAAQIQKFVDECGALTILLRNNKTEQIATSNDSDKNVLDYDYDYEFYNNGDLNDLKQEAKRLSNLLKELI